MGTLSNIGIWFKTASRHQHWIDLAIPLGPRICSMQLEYIFIQIVIMDRNFVFIGIYDYFITMPHIILPWSHFTYKNLSFAICIISQIIFECLLFLTLKVPNFLYIGWIYPTLAPKGLRNTLTPFLALLTCQSAKLII